jgi:adenylate cyclase
MSKQDMAQMSVEDIWRYALTETHYGRFSYLPSAARCTVCSTPFAGISGTLAKLTGWRVSTLNPHICNYCEEILPVGGAEVDIAVLFADVRGSTRLAAGMSATEFAQLMNRFYSVATKVLVRHRAVIDKLIGDEVMAFFIQANDPDPDRLGYRRAAVEAARDLMKEVGYQPGGKPWLPLAIGVHAGEAYVGKVGSDRTTSFTALGDMVNTTAALRSEARAGEILLSDALFETVSNRCSGVEPRTVTLKGKDASVLAHSLCIVPGMVGASSVS